MSDRGSKRNHDSLKRSTQILQLSLSDCLRLTTRPPSLDFTAGTGHASDDHSQSHHTNAGDASLVCVCVCVIIGCRVFPRWSERRRRVPIEHRICSRAQLGEEGRPVGPPAAARAAAAPEGAVEHARAVTTIGGLLQPRASLSGVTVRIVHPSAPEGGCSNELGAPPLRRRALPKGHCPPAVARALCARARALARPLASRVECVRVCGGGGGMCWWRRVCARTYRRGRVGRLRRGRSGGCRRLGGPRRSVVPLATPGHHRAANHGGIMRSATVPRPPAAHPSAGRRPRRGAAQRRAAKQEWRRSGSIDILSCFFD